MLRHRVALKLITYADTAAYLNQHYEPFSEVFKGKNIRAFHRNWYEFIWPRNAHTMLARPKIITPRLTRKVRFALDTRGVVPQDSCITLAPGEKTRGNFAHLTQQLAGVLQREATMADVLKYSLAYLNSSYAQPGSPRAAGPRRKARTRSPTPFSEKSPCRRRAGHDRDPRSRDPPGRVVRGGGTSGARRTPQCRRSQDARAGLLICTMIAVPASVASSP